MLWDLSFMSSVELDRTTVLAIILNCAFSLHKEHHHKSHLRLCIIKTFYKTNLLLISSFENLICRIIYVIFFLLYTYVCIHQDVCKCSSICQSEIWYVLQEMFWWWGFDQPILLKWCVLYFFFYLIASLKTSICKLTMYQD